VDFTERAYYMLLPELIYLGVIIFTLVRPVADNLRPCVATVRRPASQDIYTVTQSQESGPCVTRRKEHSCQMINKPEY
jgi:hypothetical protein